MQLLVSERVLIAGLAFPDERGFIPPPSRQMPVEAVVGNIDLAADKPLRVWWFPLQHSVPFLAPMKLFRHARPKGFRIGRGLRTQPFQLLHRFKVRLLGTTRPPRKGSLLLPA